MATIIEQEIHDHIRDRVAAITPRYDPTRAFQHFGLSDLENTQQPGAHRFFSIEWGEEIELEELTGIITQANLRRHLLVTVLHRVPGRESEHMEHLFACDSADIITQLVAVESFVSADDGELFSINPVSAVREMLGQTESAAVMTIRFEVRYRRDLQ